MKWKSGWILVAATMVAATSACEAGERAEGGEIEEASPGLAAQAKVDGETARATALARVSGGEVVGAELEREGGRLIYSFDIEVPGKSGIEEVQVDALSGNVVSQEHESEAQEAAEADEEREADEAEEGHAASGAPVALVEDGAGLLARAGVTDQAARAAALARVPGGRIVAAEIEEEDGALIFSYDVKVAGREGVEEVHVDALTGQVLSVEHEGDGEGGA